MLQVYDERGPGAAASPGLFAPNTQVKFALYRPQAYVPLESTFPHNLPACLFVGLESPFRARALFMRALLSLVSLSSSLQFLDIWLLEYAFK